MNTETVTKRVGGWDYPERTPAYVRRAAVSFLIDCQQNATVPA